MVRQHMRRLLQITAISGTCFTAGALGALARTSLELSWPLSPANPHSALRVECFIPTPRR